MFQSSCFCDLCIYLFIGSFICELHCHEDKVLTKEKKVAGKRNKIVFSLCFISICNSLSSLDWGWDEGCNSHHEYL